MMFMPIMDRHAAWRASGQRACSEDSMDEPTAAGVPSSDFGHVIIVICYKSHTFAKVFIAPCMHDACMIALSP